MMRPANEAVYWLTGSFGERQPRVPTAGDFSNRELTVSRPKIFVFVPLVLFQRRVTAAHAASNLGAQYRLFFFFFFCSSKNIGRLAKFLSSVHYCNYYRTK